jgi:hypothetical protein
MFLAYRWSRTALADDSERHGHCSWLTVGVDQHFSSTAKEDELTDDNKRDGHVLG